MVGKVHLAPGAASCSPAVQKRTECARKGQVKIGARALIEPDVGKRVLIEPDVGKKVRIEPDVGKAQVKGAC